MNVYDFDRTLYPGDASLDFWRWCLRRHPATRRFLPGQLFFFGLWLTGLCGRTRFKAAFFAFLRAVPDVPAEVAAFWAERTDAVAPWYPTMRRADDCVVSASPAFLARACPWLPRTATVLATETDSRTGRISGRNCRGEEKVRRFRERFPAGAIERFYSDSLSNAPLAGLAAQAFLVRRGAPLPWAEGAGGARRVAAHFLSVRFLIGISTVATLVFILANLFFDPVIVVLRQRDSIQFLVKNEINYLRDSHLSFCGKNPKARHQFQRNLD